MIFITGATGLLGSHLAFELIKKGYKVRGGYRNPSSLEKVKALAGLYGQEYINYIDQIEWVEADMLDMFSIYQALENVTQVYHCAGYISFHPGDNKNLMEINYLGTRNVVNACLEKNTEAFCMVSSVAALGNTHEENVITETAFRKNTKIKTGYGYSKYKGEMEVWRGMTEGLNAVIVNPSVILGPGHWESGSGRLFSRIYRGFKYYTDGITGYVDVHDAVHAMIALMEHNAFGERYILNGQNLSFKAIFTLIAAALQVKPPRKKVSYTLARFISRLEWVKWKVTGIPPSITKQNVESAFRKRYYSSDKIKQQLNFEFTPIDQSISRIAKYYKVK